MGPCSRLRRPPRLVADRRGGAAVDFALVAPVFILLVAGVLEFGVLMLGETLLQSAVTDASRFGLTGRTLAGQTREEVIADIVAEHSFGLIDPERLAFDTLVYPSFDSVGRPESFTDQNGNGTWDAGEPYADINGNGQWDADMGAAGLGGPEDVVLYRVRYDWEMLTPLFRAFFPPSGTVPMEASLAIRNEPFPEAGP
ncbi:MAG: TadE/TadG family type IV pilus assembly protein [Geminicoccaceae bacterium]